MRPRDELPYLEWTTKAGETVRVYADVVEDEGFAAPSLITEHAVESGSNPSDHIQPEPLTYTCVMFFSECPVRGDLSDEQPGKVSATELSIPPYPNLTPLLSPRGLTNAVGAGLNAVGSALGIGGAQGPTQVTALRFDEPPGRLRLFIEQLLEERANKTLFAVGASFARLESMGLENAELHRTSADGDSGSVSLSFRQVSFVSTESAAALPLPLEPRGQLKKNTTTATAADVPAGPQKSVAAAALDTALGR
jgi:hypothetical protein